MRFCPALLFVLVINWNACAQDGTEDDLAFNTPIPSSLEEAVKLQFVEGASLPSKFETILFAVDQPIGLRVGTEIDATNVVGRNLRMYLSPLLPKEGVELLILEACKRVPYSGWRENAALLSTQVSEKWISFIEQSNTENATLVIPTQFYKFTAKMSNYPKSGTPPELIIYNTTFGVSDMKAGALESLRSEMGMFARNGQDAAANSEASTCAEWFWSRVNSDGIHQTRIALEDNRWPIAVHVRLASSPNDWSYVVGERSEKAEGIDQLKEQTLAVFGSILSGKHGYALRDPAIQVLFNQDGGTAGIIDGIEHVTDREDENGFVRLIIKFRCRNGSTTENAK